MSEKEKIGEIIKMRRTNKNIYNILKNSTKTIIMTMKFILRLKRKRKRQGKMDYKNRENKKQKQK